MNPKNASLSGLIAILVVIALALLGYRYLTMPDDRSATDRLGDAIHALPEGGDKAARELEDRTPGQKLGDVIKDETGSKQYQQP